jgi:hypothetical protein
MSCRTQVGFQPAELGPDFPLPELGAILARGIDLPEKPPSPAKDSQAGPGPLSPPPPHRLRVWEEGGGAGEPTRPARASQTGTFPSFPLHGQFTCSV